MTQDTQSAHYMLPGLTFDNSYQRLPERFYELVEPNRVKAPKLIKLNKPLAKELGLDVDGAEPETLAKIFSGDEAIENGQLLSMNYSGHQFGHFNPHMGDGRTGLIGEVLDANGRRYDLQLKGSGRTPFSKTGDGKSGLGPVMREFIISEAMHALGVPTTRSLAITATGEFVFREGPAPGAVLTRVAASHIRIGTFQYFAARGDVDGVRAIADYAIDRHNPELAKAENPYLALLDAVISAQAKLVAKWMSIGFIHGVMNTDNMTISGETIDYGPCAFMDLYDHNKVYSSIDREGRYAYGAQPNIAQWNLARFAETLLPLIDEDDEQAVAKAKDAIETYPDKFMSAWANNMAPKFGLTIDEEDAGQDRELMRKFLALLQRHHTDFTNSFRLLNDVLEDAAGAHVNLQSQFGNDDLFTEWYALWRGRIGGSDDEIGRALSMMGKANPIYIPRNHLVEEAIIAGEQNDDFEPMEKLLAHIVKPFEMQPETGRYALPPSPDEEVHQTFCGT